MATTPIRHWIITNRRVRGDHVDERDHEPLATFRVASFTPPPDGASDDAYRAAVAFVPDKDDSVYQVRGADADAERLKGTAQMFLALYQSMCNAPADKGDTLFFIHGFNYGWMDALRNLAQLHRLYVEPASSPVGQIVYFSWPSYGELGKYMSDQPVALNSGAVLGRLFAKVGAFYEAAFVGKAKLPFCQRRLHLGAHSMGNQVLEAFCRVLSAFPATTRPLFQEAVLLNADADWESCNETGAMARLNQVCERVHIYSNYADTALLVSEVTKNRAKRLGRHGPRDLRTLQPRALVVDATPHAPLLALPADGEPFTAAQAADVLDAAGARASTSPMEDIVNHWGYLYRPNLIADVHAVLRGESSAAIGGRSAKAANLFVLG